MSTPSRTGSKAHHGRNVTAGILLGLGTVAFIDEAVFHQLLHWHQFYDLGASGTALVSDGLFHAFSWFATVASLLMVAGLYRERTFWSTAFAAGWLTGAGFFQLYDGLVQHKVLGIHQIRYGVNLLPYDVAWNAIAVVLLVAGSVLWTVTARRAGRRTEHARA